METIINLTFGIRSDTLDPQDVTERMGLTPAHSFRQGDKYSTKDGRILERPFGVWQVRSDGMIDSTEIEQHAQYVLSVIEPVRESLTPYLNDESIYVEIRIWCETESETGGYSLSSNIMARLARICKAINFTYILKANDNE